VGEGARRIVLLGRAGTGKTTFARRLAVHIGAPFLCLDDIWADGVQDTDAFRSVLAAAHAGDRWVSDGNFAKVSFDLRLPRADLVIWLEAPRLVCAARAVRRVFRSGERHRASGLPEVMAYIWRFDRVNRPLIEGLRTQHAPETPVLRLRSGREAEAWLKGVAP
jgi:adenylate kinase family enzyme